MPAGRPRNHAKHLHHAVSGLVAAMEGLLKTLGAAGPKLPPEMKHAAVPVNTKGQRGPGKGNRKLKSALKSVWANYTPAQRAARIAKMKAGHAKRKRGKAAPRKAVVKRATPAPMDARPKPRGAWASMTPEQRAARIAAMRAGHAKRKGAKAGAAETVVPRSVVL